MLNMIQVLRVHRLLVSSRSIRMYEDALEDQRNVIERGAIIITLRCTQWYYRCVLASYMRSLREIIAMEKQLAVAEDINALIYFFSPEAVNA